MRGDGLKLCRWSAATLAAAFLAPAGASAGAWTQPQGQGQATVSLYGWTGRAAPYGYVTPPKENEVESQLYVEYGLADKVMVIGSMALERYSILSPVDNTYVGPDYSQLGVQYQFAKGDNWVFSGSTSFFLPGARNASEPAQNGNTGGAAEARLLGGRSFKVGAMDGFLDVEVAYRDRTAGPPSEWHGDFTVGLKPDNKWTLMLQSFNEVTQGAGARGFPQVVESVEQASVIYALNAHWFLQISAFASAVSNGTNSERGGVLSVTRKF